MNGTPSSAIPDNRIDKNNLRAAGTVEQKQQINNSKLVYPARTDTVRKATPVPAKKKRSGTTN